MSLRLLAVVFFFGFSQMAPAADFSRLIVFGDSLSDTGNLAAIRGDLPPPYFQNRISNGPVAVEVLAERLGLRADASLHLLGRRGGTNYAVAGGRARGQDVIDLSGQVVAFLAQHGNDAPRDALYVVFIGGNDVRDARDANDADAANEILDDAVDDIVRNVRLLSRAGARSFLVMNSADVSLIPETRLRAAASNDAFFVRRAAQVSDRFADNLRRRLQRLRREQAGLFVQEVDIYGASRRIAQQAARLGLSNITDACFNSRDFSFHPDCPQGSGFDRFYFFDEIHPTAKVHRQIGEGIHRGLVEAGGERLSKAKRVANDDR